MTSNPSPHIRCRLVFSGGAVLNLLVHEPPRVGYHYDGEPTLPPRNWSPVEGDQGDELAWIDWSQVVAISYRYPPGKKGTGRPNGRPEELSDRSVVEAIQARGGRVESIRVLANDLGFSRPTVTRRVDRLATLGVVELEDGARGAVAIRLTNDPQTIPTNCFHR